MIYLQKIFATVCLLVTLKTLAAGGDILAGPGGISGPTSVTEGDLKQYSYSGSVGIDACWAVSGPGYIVSTSSTQSGVYTANVQWTGPGTGTVRFLQSSCSTEMATLSVIVAGYVPNPATTFSISYTCGNTVVTRAGAPASKYSWYWQTSSSGTSLTLGKDASITLTATTPLYLRGRRNDYPNDWGTAQSVGTVMVYTSPPSPPTVAHNGLAFSGTPVTMSVEGPPEATAYKWYNGNNGGTPISGVTTNTYTTMLAASRDFFVSVVTACESTGRLRVTGSLEPLPVIVVARGGFPTVNMGQSIDLTTSQVYDSYQWRNDADAIVGTSRTFAATVAGTYTVTVTKSGVSGAGVSAPITVTSGLDGLDMNYVHTLTPQVALDEVDETSVDVNTQSISYFDGLGRGVQNVAIQASPGRVDVVQPLLYDFLGREAQKYAPFSAEKSGIYKPAVINAAGEFTGLAQDYYSKSGDAIADDPKPYAATVFEASPLNRVVKQGAVGEAWQPAAAGSDHTVKMDYVSNADNEVMQWEPDYTTGLPVQVGYYAANTLSVKAVADEHDNTILEYTDSKGHMVLRRVEYGKDSAGTAQFASTYYIYDDFGNLVTVLPPEAVKELLGN